MKDFVKKILDNKSLKYKITLAITLLGLLTIVSGGSYALLRGNIESVNEQVIEIGKIKLLLTEGFENIDSNATPLTNVEGLLLEDTYNFSVKNVGDSPAKIEVKLLNSAPNDYTGDVLEDTYIQVGLEVNGEETGPMNLEEVNNIINKNIINKNEIINYKLRIWLDKSQLEDLEDKEDSKMFLKLSVDAKQETKTKNNKLVTLDKSGANSPVLSENMIPVYYDEEAEVWKKADSTNENETYKWYDYNNKIWANSVTVSSTNRETYLSADPGTTIPMDDILTMQVWIPRYKYKIFNYNANGTTYVDPQEIDIVFENGTESTGEVTCTDTISGTNGAKSESCKINNAECTNATCNNKYYTHPAFTFGSDELEGIWIGKFEVSPSEDSMCYTYASVSNCNVTGITPLVKPDVSSYRSAQIGTFETNMMAMNDENNIYGFNTTTDDTHMMKNMEWGAAAYLSHSKYGVNREVYINNSSSYYTGRSGGNIGGSTPINGTYTEQTSTTQSNTYGFYTYDGYLLNYGTNTKSETKDLSKVASTTGNIYGIYDMSGGAHEYVMGNIVYSDGTTMMSGYTTSSNSGYTGYLYSGGSYTGTYIYPLDKYYDKYSYGGNTQRIRAKLGDAVKEVGTSSSNNWYSDYGFLPSSDGPWFDRGGYYNLGSAAGVFYSIFDNGSAHSVNSARLVVSLLSS